MNHLQRDRHRLPAAAGALALASASAPSKARSNWPDHPVAIKPD